MTDLKKEITRIQEAVRATNKDFNGVNKWYEIVKVAYERGELINLLSGDDEYIYDADGKLWLAPDPKLGPDNDPLAIRTLFSSGVNIYGSDCPKDLQKAFIKAFCNMLDGSPKQIYFAISIFYQLANIDNTYKSNALSQFYLASFGISEYISDSLRPILKKTLNIRKVELSNTKIFNCKDNLNGVYDYALFYSKLLEKYGINGFVEV